MKIYVAGPMAGYHGLNFQAFHDADDDLVAKGHEVVNPAELNPDLNADWTECILTDIKALSSCDGIYMLKGWEDSYGARIEHLVAQKLKLHIEYERDD